VTSHYPADARLEKDSFRLLPWATETNEQGEGWEGKRVSQRRHSDRATVDDDPKADEGQQSTLTEL
jgi:hypothetical protein